MANNNIIKSISLYFTNDKSDKVYCVSIAKADSGFMVHYANGKRGSTLRKGDKTKSPVDLKTAEKLYNKTVNAKIKSGYTEEEDGKTFTSSDLEGQHSGISPQLLNPVDEEDLERLLCDDNYVMERKFDGERRGTRNTESGTEGINKKGMVVSLSTEIADSISSIVNQNSLKGVIFDGEDLGDDYAIFDVISVDGVDVRNKSVKERIKIVNSLVNETINDIKNIFVTPFAYTEQEKRELLQIARDENWEGVVFKDLRSSYEAGRPNSGGTHLKFKFFHTASFVVIKQNIQRSVQIAVVNESGELQENGNVTIPANKEIPEVGDIVECRYLYAMRSHRLHVPTYLKKRKTVVKAECVISQLRYQALCEVTRRAA